MITAEGIGQLRTPLMIGSSICHCQHNQQVTVFVQNVSMVGVGIGIMTAQIRDSFGPGDHAGSAGPKQDKTSRLLLVMHYSFSADKKLVSKYSAGHSSFVDNIEPISNLVTTIYYLAHNLRNYFHP